MKTLFSLVLTLILVGSCSNEKHFIFSNTGSFSRTDEPIILSRAILDSAFHKDISSYFPLLITVQGDTIPCQTDDLDGDNKWDELFLLADFGPFEKKEVIVRLIDPFRKPIFKVRSNLRFAKVIERGRKYEVVSKSVRLKSTATELSQAAFQMEGPAWESDRVAFRNYFDARNGIDIYGKTTAKMILDSVGTGENYHSLQWWGMDILHVGNSLGAGAIGMMEDDSLFRLDLPESGGFEAVSRGPLRIVFRLDYKNWKFNGHSLNVIHEISTWGGFYGYQSKVSISGAVGSSKLISGIVNIHSDSLHIINSISSFTSIFTHDKQAENGAHLGMGLIIPNKLYAGYASAPITGAGITQTYYARLNIEPGIPAIFRFYAAWENAKAEFGNEIQFSKFLEAEAEKLSRPIIVKVE
jgi:hypothetical protein